MIPLIFVFKSKINVCSETKKFKFFQFQEYDENFESRKLSHNEIMHSSSQWEIPTNEVLLKKIVHLFTYHQLVFLTTLK